MREKHRHKSWLWLCVAFLFGPLAFAEQVPAGTQLEIRLQQPVSTFSSKKNTEITALLVAPVRRDDRLVLPLGLKVSGHVVQVQRVGLGVVHETAALGLEFDRVEFLNGQAVNLKSRVLEVQNARETVDPKGVIRGVRATETLAYRSAGVFNFFAMSNPIGLMFTTSASASVLRFSEPEILLPAGTELGLQVLEDLEVPEAANSDTAPVAETEADRGALAELVAQLPFRTYTDKSNRPSDFTNLVFIGSQTALERAMTAAGWVPADPLNAQTAYRSLRSMLENQGYQSAPMSTLLLDGRRPDYAYAKTVNTFSKRHHMRIWAQTATWKGNPVWTSSSTQDIGIAFSKPNRTFIHLIDTRIDNERAKIVNDLVLTGCVDAMNLVMRPWLPEDAKNGTGEALVTDGKIAVINLNRCDPQQSGDSSGTPSIPRANRVQRVTRQTILTLKNNLVRENAVYMAYGGITYLRKRRKTPAGFLPERQIELEGDRYVIANSTEARTSWMGKPAVAEEAIPKPAEEGPLPGRQRWQPLMLEIGVHGGYARYASEAFGGVGFTFDAPGEDPLFFGTGNSLNDGWNTGITVTLNSYRYFSHEFGFDYLRTKFMLGALFAGTQSSAFEEQTSGLVTAQFSYNLLFNLRPRESRWRPYLAVGPALQLMHIENAPLKKAPVYFKFGLQNIGIISAAYDFGSDPPLEGGGIFQPGLQYGGGLKVRVTKRWLWRLDFRETLTSQPDFWSKSLQGIRSSMQGDPTLQGWTVTMTGPVLSGALRQQRVSSGISFAF